MSKERRATGSEGGGGSRGRASPPGALALSLNDWPAEELEKTFMLEPLQAGELLAAPETPTPALDGPLTGRLTIRPLNEGCLLVQGRIEARVQAACDFCLAEYVEPLTIAFEEPVRILRPEASSPQKEAGLGDAAADDDDEDFFPLPEKNGCLNLWPLVAEQFWLAWPLRFSCRSDCRGLCPVCGADLNRGDCGCHPAKAAAYVPGVEILKKF